MKNHFCIAEVKLIVQATTATTVDRQQRQFSCHHVKCTLPTPLLYIARWSVLQYSRLTYIPHTHACLLKGAKQQTKFPRQSCAITAQLFTVKFLIAKQHHNKYTKICLYLHKPECIQNAPEFVFETVTKCASLVPRPFAPSSTVYKIEGEGLFHYIFMM